MSVRHITARRAIAGVAILSALALATAACTGPIDSSPTTTSSETAAPSSQTAIEDSGLLIESGDADVRSVAVGPSALVAVGHDPRQQNINEDDEAAVWISRDGSDWSRVETDPSFVDASMSDVAWFDPQEIYVAVGTHVSEGAIWVSEDGRSWSRVALLPFTSPPGGGIEVDAVVVTAEPALRALGREWLSEGESVSAEWSSQDGVIWNRIDSSDGS